jgi:putative oxidoreductase
MNHWLLLTRLERHADQTLFLLRVIVGAFLIWGVWDNIASSTRMHEFTEFLAKFQFPVPALMAQLSVWVQFAIGIAFILGAFTRWAGILCTINFIVAIVMVDRFAGLRGAFASICLVLIGLYLATQGAGRFSVDARWKS